MSGYCLKCKKNTNSTNSHQITSKNGRHMIQSNCSTCGTKKTKFISTKQAGSGIETSLMADEAYKEQKKRADEVNGYKLDRNKSTRNIAVYKNDKGEAIVSNRGTDLSRKSTAMKDLKDDAKIVVGKAPKERIKKTVKVTKELQAQGYNVHQTGHSLGANIASNTARKTGTTADVYSAGSSLFGKQQSKNENVTSYRTKNDPIALSVNRLGVGKDIIIEQKGNNPHSLKQFVDLANKKK